MRARRCHRPSLAGVAAAASDLVVALGALLRALRRFLRRLRAAGRLGHHVDDDEVGRARRPRRSPACPRSPPAAGSSPRRGTACSSGRRSRSGSSRRPRAAARRSRRRPCSHGSNCSSSIMKRRNSFAAFGYFVYLKIIWLKNRCDSVGTPTGPTGNDGVVDVGRHLLDLRVGRVLRRVVDRDAVVGDADLAVEERLVVVRVEPRQRAGDEGRVELLAVLERLRASRGCR